MAGASGVAVVIPETQRLLNEAQALELQANGLEAQTRPPVDRAAQRRQAREEWIRWEKEESRRQERKEIEDSGHRLLETM